MIIISSSLALSPTADNPLNTPVFGWESLVTASNVTATSAADGFPATNVANYSTNLRWTAEPGSPVTDQYLTVSITEVDPIDFLAVAVHNFGSDSIPVSVEGSTGGSPEWFELNAPQMLANDDPVIFRFTPQSLTGIRLRMQVDASPVLVPFVSVLYVGKLLVCERGTHQDYIPINLAKTTVAPIGVSESGHFLGRVVISEGRNSPFSLKLLRATWFRENMQPMIAAAKTTPVFFAWKPTEFPSDMGFVFITNDPQGRRHFETGRMSVEFQMTGVAVA
jgi:hypothetical protein